MKQKIDFLAIGDVVTDAFIQLIDAQVTKDTNGENPMLSMRFGDKIPYESRIVLPGVGNAPNASVAASRLGLASALIAITGNDRDATETLEHFKKESVITDFITSQQGVTNYHYVLRYGAERTILIKHEAFKYEFNASKFEGYDIGWVYLTTIADGLDEYYEELINWLEANPNIKFAFQPGTFQIKAGIEKMKRVYARANALFCNKDEARLILSLPHADYPELHAAMRALGPKIVCITDGPNGATISDETKGWFVPMYPDPKPPVERTGAGDACSSTTVVAMAHGNDLPTALSWGTVNSMSVVQQVGAQGGLLSSQEIEQFLKNAPDVFVPKQLW